LDVFASEDAAAETAAYGILGIIQQFVTEKGL